MKDPKNNYLIFDWRDFKKMKTQGRYHKPI